MIKQWNIQAWNGRRTFLIIDTRTPFKRIKTIASEKYLRPGDLSITQNYYEEDLIRAHRLLAVQVFFLYF